jgi:hypothetical protein
VRESSKLEHDDVHCLCGRARTLVSKPPRLNERARTPNDRIQDQHGRSTGRSARTEASSPTTGLVGGIPNGILLNANQPATPGSNERRNSTKAQVTGHMWHEREPPRSQSCETGVTRRPVARLCGCTSGCSSRRFADVCLVADCHASRLNEPARTRRMSMVRTHPLRGLTLYIGRCGLSPRRHTDNSCTRDELHVLSALPSAHPRRGSPPYAVADVRPPRECRSPGRGPTRSATAAPRTADDPLRTAPSCWDPVKPSAVACLRG